MAQNLLGPVCPVPLTVRGKRVLDGRSEASGGLADRDGREGRDGRGEGEGEDKLGHFVNNCVEKA